MCVNSMSEGAFETLMPASPFHRRLFRADSTKLSVWSTGFHFQGLLQASKWTDFTNPFPKTFPMESSVDVPPHCQGILWLMSNDLFSMRTEIRVSLYCERSSSHLARRDTGGWGKRVRQESSSTLAGSAFCSIFPNKLPVPSWPNKF